MRIEFICMEFDYYKLSLPIIEMVPVDFVLFSEFLLE